MPNENIDNFSANTKIVVSKLVVILWVIYFSFLIAAFAFDTALKRFFVDHMDTSIAVPLAGLSAFLMVALLEINSCPVKFEGLGFKLSDAAGSAMFWVIGFLTILAGIRLVAWWCLAAAQ